MFGMWETLRPTPRARQPPEDPLRGQALPVRRVRGQVQPEAEPPHPRAPHPPGGTEVSCHPAVMQAVM